MPSLPGQGDKVTDWLERPNRTRGSVRLAGG